MRDAAPITGATLRSAVDGSLRRLQTEYIDLYQLHWPNRGSYHFRQMWRYAPTGTNGAAETVHVTEVLTAAQALVAEGKVRSIGLSNESVWGGGALAASGQYAGLATYGHGLEGIPSALPAVRYRLGRTEFDRGFAASRLLSACRWLANREIRGRCDARPFPAQS